MKIKDNEITAISTLASCSDKNGTIWIFSDSYNALFSFKDGKTTYIKSFEDESFFASHLYNKAFQANDEIFFFPLSAKKIACYSTINNHVEYIELPNRKDNIYYNVICINDNELFLFPVNQDEYAYTFNFPERKITCHKIPWIKLDFDRNISLIGDAFIKQNESVYLAASYTNVMLQINLKNDEYKKIYVGDTVFRTHAYNDLVYVSNSSGSCIMTLENDQLKGVLENDNNDYKCINKNNMKYIDFIIYHDNIMLLPINNDNVFIKEENNFYTISLCDNSNQPYDVHCISDNKIFLMPYQTSEAIVIDLYSHNYSVLKLNVTLKEYETKVLKYLEKEKRKKFNEENMPLKTFISLIIDGYI